jgi:hypothetical protein
MGCHFGLVDPFAHEPLFRQEPRCIIIKVFRTVNKEKYNRCEERKGLFMGCTLIKAWINKCYFNCQKFNCCAQYNLINGFKKEQKLTAKINEGTEKVDAQTRSSKNMQKLAKYG